MKKCLVSAWRCECSRLLGRAVASCSRPWEQPRWKRALRTPGAFSVHVAYRKTVERDESASTGCRRSVMYVGALPMRVRWTSRHSLTWIVREPRLAASVSRSSWLRHGRLNVSRTRVSCTAALVQWSCTAVRRAELCRSQSMTTRMRDEVGSDITTQHASNLSQTLQVEEARLCYFGDVCSHAEFTVSVHYLLVPRKVCANFCFLHHFLFSSYEP